MNGSRQRFLATVNHQRPDRVPLDLWARPEVMRQLQEYLGTADVEEALGVDFASIQLEEWVTDFEARAEAPKGGDWPGSGGRYIWHDDRTFENAWGVLQRVGQDGKLVEWVSGPLVDTTDLDGSALPDVSCLVDAASVAERVAHLKRADKVVLAEVAMPFKRAWSLRGMQNLLCDMLVDRDFVERLYDRIYGFETERAIRCAQAGVDCIQVVGDIAMENSLLFSPTIFRSLDVPRLRELIRKAQEVKPDVLFFYHSDGDISALMDDLIEVGFDIINPIQPECMNPYEVKRNWGEKVTIWGTISVRTTLPQGPPDAVYSLVQERIRQCGRSGGLVIAPANVIMYDTPVENIVAMYEAARQFDWDTPGTTTAVSGDK